MLADTRHVVGGRCPAVGTRGGREEALEAMRSARRRMCGASGRGGKASMTAKPGYEEVVRVLDEARAALAGKAATAERDDRQWQALRQVLAGALPRPTAAAGGEAEVQETAKAVVASVKVLQVVVAEWLGEWREAARIEAASRKRREEGHEYKKALMLLWRERQLRRRWRRGRGEGGGGDGGGDEGRGGDAGEGGEGGGRGGERRGKDAGSERGVGTTGGGGGERGEGDGGGGGGSGGTGGAVEPGPGMPVGGVPRGTAATDGEVSPQGGQGDVPGGDRAVDGLGAATGVQATYGRGGSGVGRAGEEETDDGGAAERAKVWEGEGALEMVGAAAAVLVMGEAARTAAAAAAARRAVTEKRREARRQRQAEESRRWKGGYDALWRVCWLRRKGERAKSWAAAVQMLRLAGGNGTEEAKEGGGGGGDRPAGGRGDSAGREDGGRGRERQRRGERGKGKGAAAQQRHSLVSRQDLGGTRAVALLLYMRSRAAGRASETDKEGGGGAGGASGAGLGRRRGTDSNASEHSAGEQSSCKFGQRGESSASATDTSCMYERSYLKRERAVVEEEGEGPKRPRRLRVREGAYIGPDVLC